MSKRMDEERLLAAMLLAGIDVFDKSGEVNMLIRALLERGVMPSVILSAMEAVADMRKEGDNDKR